MRTQINCPQCGTPFATEVHQLIDARQPELKQMLLNGQLNMAVCPSCRVAFQLASPLVYHDPAYDLFMIHLPQEMRLSQMQREELIGRLTRQVVDSLPMQQRRAYLLQPQTILTLQTFIEKVLETEGITPEMIARQKKQAELLNTLIKASPDVVDYLLKQRSSEIDETFFAMLRSYVDAAMQTEDNKQLIPLLNLQAKLMTSTAVGRRLEKRQIALHKFNQAAKKQNGLTSALLLEHVLLNQEDEEVVQIMVGVGQAALAYEFFSGLTLEIEKQGLMGNKAGVQRLTRLRDDLLKLQEEMQTESRQMMQQANQLLQQMMSAPDVATAVGQNLAKIDDAFMYVLSMQMARAEQEGHNQAYQRLSQIQAMIMNQIEGQAPPEIQFLNYLVQAESEAAQIQLLDQNKAMLSPDMLKVVDALLTQVKANPNRSELYDRLERVRGLIQARI